MSKKIELNLTLQEIKTLLDSLAKLEIGYCSPLFDKLDEKYDMNVEPEDFGEDYATEWTHYRIGGKCFKKEFIERINK